MTSWENKLVKNKTIKVDFCWWVHCFVCSFFFSKESGDFLANLVPSLFLSFVLHSISHSIERIFHRNPLECMKNIWEDGVSSPTLCLCLSRFVPVIMEPFCALIFWSKSVLKFILEGIRNHSYDQECVECSYRSLAANSDIYLAVKTLKGASLASWRYRRAKTAGLISYWKEWEDLSLSGCREYK